MKTVIAMFTAIATIVLLGATADVHAAPSVSNVRAAQIPGTRTMAILYDLAGPTTVAVTLTVKNGATVVPSPSTTGAVGPGIAAGADLEIGWDMAADWSSNVGTLTFEVTADDGIPDGFVLIPAGTNSGTDPDFGAYSLTVNNAFYMAKYETTKAQWDAVRTWALNNGYTDLPAGGDKDDTHPVHSVSWFDAVKWCNARSENDGRTPCYTVSGGVYRTGEPGGVSDISCDTSATGYRLPTDVEWEYAARGGVAGKRFPWDGDTIDHGRANYRANGSAYEYDVSEYTESTYHPDYNDGTTPYTSPVGSFEQGKNAYGLYDMAGNVWEWCWDWHPNYEGSYRVSRGGCWEGNAYYCRAGGRGGSGPGGRWSGRGFRACSAAPGQ